MLRTWNILQMFFLVWSGQFCPVLAQRNGIADKALPKSSADLIVPILDLRYQSVEECGSGKSYHCTDGPGFAHEEARSKGIERLVGRLIKNKSSAADEAIVVLLHYDVGPSEAEDLLTNVKARGRKVLSYLLKHKDVVPRIPGRNYPDLMLNGREFQQAMFDHAISAIKASGAPST